MRDMTIKTKNTSAGTPKRDGSGGGTRENQGRGGCVVTRKVGIGRNK